MANTTYWKIELTVDTTVNNEILTGVGSIILKTNQPPYNGSCIVFNHTGYPLETNFTITCKNWLDDDGYITQFEYWGMLKIILKYNYKQVNLILC
jgi:hypothetical protein